MVDVYSSPKKVVLGPFGFFFASCIFNAMPMHDVEQVYAVVGGLILLFKVHNYRSVCLVVTRNTI